MLLQTTDATLTFLLPREDDKTINVVSREVQALNQKKTAQVNAMLKFVEDNKNCRSVQLVSYFGETSATNCGICSVCNQRNSKLSKVETLEIAKQILALLEGRDLTSREISERLNFTEDNIVKVIRLLMDADRIRMTPKNQFYLN